MTTRTTKDDIAAEPIRQMQEAFQSEQAQVQPPEGHRDELMTPLNAVNRALTVADQLEGRLTDAASGAADGRYSREQADRLRSKAIQDAEHEAGTWLVIGKNALDLLPRKTADQVFPDDPPRGGDIADVKADLQLGFGSIQEPNAGALATALVERTGDAIRSGDTKVAKLLMSRWGHDYLASRVGKDQADKMWSALRQQAIAEAAKYAEGTLRTHVTAHKMVDHVMRAYVTALNLVDMKMSDAKARTDASRVTYR